MPFAIAAGIGGLGSIIGGGKSADAATQAARIQANAANNATGLQTNVLGTVHNELAPYRDLVTPDIYNQYISRTDNLSSQLPAALNLNLNPFNTNAVTTGAPNVGPTTLNNLNIGPTTNGQTTPTPWDYQRFGLGANQQAALENTPGYQFTRDQGLRAVQNSEAAKGRGVSGNALTGAAQYATGLANNTFNQQLQNQMASQGQNFGQTLGSQQQQFGQQLAGGGLDLQAQQQRFAQQLGNATLGLQGQQQQFGQNLASNAQNLENFLRSQGINFQQNQNNLLLPLQQLANALNIGQSATTGGAQIGASLLPGIANTITGAGAAQAGGIIGANNAAVGGLTGAGNALSNYALFSNLFPGSGGGINSYLRNLFGSGGAVDPSIG